MYEFEFGFAVGLFEGEGYVSCVLNEKTGLWQRQIGIRMTDEDVIRRFRSIVGYGLTHGPYQPKDPSWKPNWVWRASHWDDQKTFCEDFYEFLGPRRQAQIDHFMDHPPQQRNSFAKGNTAGKAHKGRTVWTPDRTHCKNGHDLIQAGIFVNTRGNKVCRQCMRDSALRSKKKRQSAGSDS